MPTNNEVHFDRSQALSRLYCKLQESDRPDIESTLDELKLQFSEWNLCEEEVYAIAVLHNDICHGEGFLKGASIVQGAISDPTDRVFGSMLLLKMMIEGKIIRKGENLLDEQARTEFAATMSPAEFFETQFELGPDLLNFIAELTLEQDQSSAIKPYQCNEDYLNDWFTRIEILSELKSGGRINRLLGVRFHGMDMRQHPRYVGHVRKMELRRQASERCFPIDVFARDESLDEFETELIVMLLRADAVLDPIQISTLTEVLASTPSEARRIRALVESTSALRTKGILEVEHNASRLVGHLDVELSPQTLEILNDRSNAEFSLERLMNKQSFLKLVKPSRSMDEVILPEHTVSAIKNAISRYQPEIYERLKTWGLIEEATDKQLGELDEAPLRILFYGPSGTGKTLTAIALAKELGRQLLVTDVSKILGCYVGDSEKNLRRVLDIQRQIVKKVSRPPIFFLNECDQLLQRREFGSDSVDRMYNQMMTMWLEAFENMRGIVIATTNLTENMDEAFSRRFQLKLEFGHPDLNSRILLWKKHIKPTIPLADDIDVNTLAASFFFTGGQIAIAVEIAATEAAMRGDHLTQADLIRAAKQEDAGTIDHSARLKGKFGFLENAA